MSWNLQEAVEYYRRQGAPGDQNALKNLLTEVQEEHGGSVPKHLLPELARSLNTKESFLNAVIRRYPSLRLSDVHILEICAGPNCSRRGDLARLAEQYRGRVEVRLVPRRALTAVVFHRLLQIPAHGCTSFTCSAAQGL